MSRTRNAIRNAYFGIINKVALLVLAFVSRTVFIYVLGNTYLGVNGLYSEILHLLSFAELGFGSAMTFAMYKPVADNNEEKVIRLLDYYKHIYRAVAGVIAAAGVCLIPFLPKIVRGADWLSVRELQTYFLIFLFNTVVGYFVTFKYSYTNALQKNYIQTNISTVVQTASYIAQIVVILCTRSFLAYLLINSAVLLVSRFLVHFYLNRKYPILKRKPAQKITREEKAPILTEVRSLVVHQFSNVAVHSTDNILISTVTGMGVVAVGYISNYNMLINSVLGFVVIIFSSVTSGFGNMVAASTTENYHKSFKEMNFLSFWIYGFCVIAFFVLIPPFITLWIGADKLIDSGSFILILANCYLQGQSTIYGNARNAKGAFYKDKQWAAMQAVVNLVVSIIAGRAFGLVGIYIGTVTSRMVYVIFRPYSTYKFLFDTSCAEYYMSFAKYLAEVLIAGFLTYLVTKPILLSVTWGRFIAAALVVALVPNLLFLLFSIRGEELAAWDKRIRGILRKKY